MDNVSVMTIAIYTHPELYPPVLNMIDELSGICGKINLLSRNLVEVNWIYPAKVNSLKSGVYKPVRESEKAGTGWKIKSFLQFTRDFYKILKKEKTEWVMCNDPISLYAFRMIRPWLRYPVKLWYHSHDVSEPAAMRKYSIGYFAVKAENRSFSRIDLFTLPSESRLKYYPMDHFTGKWLLIPNFPSLQRTENIPVAQWEQGKVLKMIYQGRVSNEHGLEEILEYIKTDDMLNLTIIGPGQEEYIQSLRTQVEKSGIGGRVKILQPVPYAELLNITARHQLGLAVNKPMNILYSTAALASNKIYEYSAVGLPVLYFRDGHYVKHLDRFAWAFSTDLTLPDLSSIITIVRKNFQELSGKAVRDFKSELNFGAGFHPVLSYLSNSNH